MKTKLIGTIAIILGMIMTMPLTSCGEDNDEPDTPTAETNTYTRVHYVIRMAQTWYDYYDVEVTYTDVEGVSHTETINQDSQYDETVPTSKAGKKFDIDIVAKPKAEIPSINDTVTYSISKNCTMSVYRYADSSKTDPTVLYNNTSSNSKSVIGAELRLRVTTNRDVYSDTYGE
jgi:hypothetical protein